MRETPESDDSWKQQLRRPGSFVFLAMVVLSLAAVLYVGARYIFGSRTSDTGSSTPGIVLDPAADGVLRTTSQHFRNVAKRLIPAVASIKASRGAVERTEGEDNEEGGGDPLQDFFEQFGWRGGPFRRGPSQPQTALGSGILIDREGHIVTNNHVIENATEIVVLIGDDKTEYKAKVVGADPRTDLAVLKMLSLPQLPDPAQWADSNAVEVGDWAVAIGSPFNLEQTVTVGIVSAKGRREGLSLGDLGTDVLQTDAAINPGNSGGPLCDLDGKVIGVNSAIYTRNGGYMGIGFAIPSNVAREIVGTLLKDGKIVRGWLGVTIQPLEPDQAKELGLTGGVSVHQVVDGGPAAKAGLKAGDIITEVDGKKVTEMVELQRTIAGFKPGQTVHLKAMSYQTRKARALTVNIGEAPAGDSAAKNSAEPSPTKPDRLGLVVQAAPKPPGVVVERVRPNSVGEGVGIQAGDQILRVNRVEVSSVEAYRKALAGAKWISMEVRRKGQTLFLQFSLPE